MKKELTLSDVEPIINDLFAKAHQKPREEFELPTSHEIFAAIIEAFPNSTLGFSPEKFTILKEEIAKRTLEKHNLQP